MEQFHDLWIQLQNADLDEDIEDDNLEAIGERQILSGLGL
jgi:hypothetical protein